MSDTNVSSAPDTSTATPAAATPAAPAAPATPATNASPAATSQATPAQATPSAPASEGMVPSYRLREIREQLTREANETRQAVEAQYKRQLDQLQSQVRALVGVNPPQSTEQDAIRTQFFNLFPWAKKLEERFGDFEKVVERAGDLEAQNEHYWQSYGKQTMDRLFAKASESLGAPLTEEGKRALHSSFVGFVQSSPELTARYAEDPTIVEDFWKSFTSTFVDPVRRASTATVAGRAATPTGPQDTPGGAPRLPGAPQPKDLDERVANAWAAFQAHKGQG